MGQNLIVGIFIILLHSFIVAFLELNSIAAFFNYSVKKNIEPFQSIQFNFHRNNNSLILVKLYNFSNEFDQHKLVGEQTPLTPKTQEMGEEMDRLTGGCPASHGYSVNKAVLHKEWRGLVNSVRCLRRCSCESFYGELLTVP